MRRIGNGGSACGCTLTSVSDMTFAYWGNLCAARRRVRGIALLNCAIFVHRCDASSTTVRYSPARHPPCVDGSPVWPPDRDVYSTFQHATELVSVVASFDSATCLGSQIRFHLGKPVWKAARWEWFRDLVAKFGFHLAEPGWKANSPDFIGSAGASPSRYQDLIFKARYQTGCHHHLPAWQHLSF